MFTSLHAILDGPQIPEEAIPLSEMTECCNQHDICYDTCNSDKEKCDFDMRRCLYKICDSHAATVGEALTKGWWKVLKYNY